MFLKLIVITGAGAEISVKWFFRVLYAAFLEDIIFPISDSSPDSSLGKDVLQACQVGPAILDYLQTKKDMQV